MTTLAPRRLPLNTRTTSAAGVLVSRDDKLLMVRQARASGMRWEIPSGGQEPGESLEVVAAREAQEETGLAVNIGAVVCTYVCYRVPQATIVMGAVYRADASDLHAPLIPQVSDGIVAATFIRPSDLPTGEIGHLSGMIIDRWWQHRHEIMPAPFHVELWRTAEGYLEP